MDVVCETYLHSASDVLGLQEVRSSCPSEFLTVELQDLQRQDFLKYKAGIDQTLDGGQSWQRKAFVLLNLGWCCCTQTPQVVTNQPNCLDGS